MASIYRASSDKNHHEGAKLASELLASGITSLWYIAPLENIDSILQHGILNHDEATHIAKFHTDISNHEVQRWRDLPEKCYYRRIHEYAPLYIQPKNPMLYVLQKQGLSDKICLIKVSLEALKYHQFVFTDGNAACAQTHFYYKSNDINQIPWDTIRATSWTGIPEGKRKRCAEVLIHPKVEAEYIDSLYFRNDDILRVLKSREKPIIIDPYKFF